MAERRLALYGPNGAEVTHDSLMRHEVGHMDLTDIPNANATARLLGGGAGEMQPGPLAPRREHGPSELGP